MKIQNLVLILIVCLVQNISAQQNLYELLQVTENATSDQLKKAFRKLSIKFHPDRNSDDPNAEEKYLAIKRAYQILIDVSKRNTYDLFGEEGLAEIQKHPKPKGGDYRPQMPIPLDMFYKGGQMTFPFRRGQVCKHCKGTGDQGGEVHMCQSCNGTGKMTRVVKVHGNQQPLKMKCNVCGGSGKAPQSACPVCGGKKIVLKPRDLIFDVEKGMVDGDKVMFKGESEQGLQFYPGDVIITMRQQPHPTLKRVKNDLQVNLKISMKQAILGFERIVKQLDGRRIQIVGDYNTQDGEIIRVPGEGMPIRGEDNKYGDMLAHVDVNFIRSYNTYQLQQIRKIFQAGQSDNEL